MKLSGGAERAETSGKVAAAEGFDRPHLARYTMDNADLEREIIGLFLQQLPDIIGTLKKASSAADWRMAAHTLKGSAAAVGATAIHAAALQLEQAPYNFDVNVKNAMIATLEEDVARFHRIVTPLYGSF